MLRISSILPRVLLARPKRATTERWQRKVANRTWFRRDSRTEGNMYVNASLYVFEMYRTIKAYTLTAVAAVSIQV
eukprot:2256215-Pyramimonas_sp.AAC.1